MKIICRWAMVLAALSLASPAAAFEDLARFSALFPTDPDGAYVFEYNAPLDGLGPGSPTRYGPNDIMLKAALLQRSAPDSVTGVDFSRISGVLSIGELPRTVTVLIGAAGFADGAPGALAARGFERSENDGLPVLSRGEDYAIDPSARRQGDPFDSGVGKSQRLALGPDFLLRTAGWPEMEHALEALDSPGMDGVMWRAMLDALRMSAGPGAHLDIASGWAGSAFVRPPASVDTLSSKGASTGPLLLATVAMFAVTQTADHASLHIVIPYIDSSEANAATEVIAERLVRQPFTPHWPTIDIQVVEPHVVAVLSLDLPVADAAEVRDIYASWMSDVYGRRFQPLLATF